MTTNEDLIKALRRADQLIEWMTQYVGQMAPGSYGDCYADLNEHWMFMLKLELDTAAPEGGG